MNVDHIIEIGIYLLTLYLLFYAWRMGPANTFIMLAAMLFGYIAEHTAVTTVPQPYYYPPGLINLPGPVPLDICAGWGIIIFAAMHTVKRLNLDWRIQPLMAGFLAILIDFAEDPSFVALKNWIWTPGYPEQWFGIPWANYVGWFLIVVSFLFSLELLYRRWPAGEKIWRDALIAFVAIVPAFIVFMLGIKSFVWAYTSLGINEALLTFLIFAAAAIPILYSIPTMKRDSPLNWALLATPIYSYFWTLFGLFYTGLYQQQQALVIVTPLIIIFGMLCFIWPSIDTLNKSNKT